MVVYSVSWYVNSDLSKGVGRSKSDANFYSFTVLCRDIKDASAALQSIFEEKNTNPNVKLVDCDIKMNRVKIDSRGFNVNYIFMDGIRRPLSLSDFKDTLFKVSYNTVSYLGHL